MSNDKNGTTSPVGEVATLEEAKQRFLDHKIELRKMSEQAATVLENDAQAAELRQRRSK